MAQENSQQEGRGSTYLNSTQLLGPRLCRLDFLHCAELIRRIARNANVVVALKDNLQIANVELRRLT